MAPQFFSNIEHMNDVMTLATGWVPEVSLATGQGCIGAIHSAVGEYGLYNH